MKTTLRTLLVIAIAICCFGAASFAQSARRAPTEDSGRAPVRYETIAGRLDGYRGKDVLVEGVVTSIREMRDGVMLTVQAGGRAAFVYSEKLPPGAKRREPITFLARVPVTPTLNYLEFIRLIGDENDPQEAPDLSTLNVRFDERAEEKMFELVNAEREKVGLKPYVWNEKLRTAARRHSADMAKKNYFSHDSEHGTTVSKRVSNEGVSYSIVAENIAGGINVERAHQGLMDSPGHRQNILSKDLQEIGIGIVRSPDGGVIVTQNFIRKH